MTSRAKAKTVNVMLRMAPELHRKLVRLAKTRVPPRSLNSEIVGLLHFMNELGGVADDLVANFRTLQQHNDFLWGYFELRNDPKAQSEYVDQFFSQWKGEGVDLAKLTDALMRAKNALEEHQK
jgi:hypothetical protein